jgi:hypothetical protein
MNFAHVIYRLLSMARIRIGHRRRNVGNESASSGLREDVAKHIGL